MAKAPAVVLSEELDLYTEEEQDAAVKKATLQHLRRGEAQAKARKLMREVRGKSVVFGTVIGVVIGQVDEYENVVIAHNFSRKTAKARIRWARETTAKADQVNTFTADSNYDVEGIAVPRSRARTPEMERHERTVYKQQLQLAIEFAAQWSERQQKLAVLRAEQKKVMQELDADPEE
jgi:hypothetical protein